VPDTLHTFTQVFKTTGGDKVYGAFQHADENTQAILYTRRFFLCRPTAAVDAGSEIVNKSGDVFILADHAKYPNTHVYKAFWAETIQSWQRRVKQYDTVTGLEMDAYHQEDKGTIHVSMEPVTDASNFGFEDPQFRFVTGKAVEVGDIIGGRNVRSITEMLGVRVCTCV